MHKYFDDGFVVMATSLDALADARGAADPSSPALGRAIVSAIRAASEAAVAAHLTAGALERALAASEDCHKRGIQFLFEHLVKPVIEKVGGPLAAAVVKCCCFSSAGQQQPVFAGGNFDPAARRRAAAVDEGLDKHLVEEVGLDARDVAAAPELVDAPLLARLGAEVAAMNATLGSLPAVEENYLKRYEAALRVSTEVIDAAQVQLEAASGAAASGTCVAAPTTAANANASAAARNAGTNIETASPPLLDLLDAANDEFARSFQRVDANLLTSLVTVFGGLADTARSRTDTLHAALRASSERHEAKALRDATMLRSLRRIADGVEERSSNSSGDNAGVVSGAASAALAGVLAAYDRAFDEAALGRGAVFAVAAAAAASKNETRPSLVTLTGPATASAATAAAAAPAPAAAPAAAAPRSAACNGHHERVNNKNKRKRNKRQKPNNAPPARAPACGDSVPDDEACARLAVFSIVERERIDPAGGKWIRSRERAKEGLRKR